MKKTIIMTIGTKLAKNEIHAPLELSGLTVTSVSALSAASVISLIEVSLGRATAVKEVTFVEVEFPKKENPRHLRKLKNLGNSRDHYLRFCFE